MPTGLSGPFRLAAAITVFAAGSFATNHSVADELGAVERDTFGEVGLLEMPSARMAPDGELSITLGGISGTQHATLGFQVLPWLEGSFRYSRLFRVGTSQVDYDRSFGLKMRLFQETRYTPEISVGVRDLIGTGIYSSEYLAFTKQIWDLDFTTGLGWGRLASNGTFRNPLGLISASFDQRGTFTGEGGTVDFKQLFHGPDAGIFGGATWHTPIKNLNLTLEYSSDRYVLESGSGGFKLKSPFNIGLTYAPLQSISVTGGWFYNDTIGLTVVFSFDPTTAISPLTLDEPAIGPALRSANEGTGSAQDSGQHLLTLDGLASTEALNALLAHDAVSVDNIEVDGSALLVRLHARGNGTKPYCGAYASVAVASHIGIDTVAVTDADIVGAQAVLCSVHDISQEKARRVQIATTSDDVAITAHAIDARAIQMKIRSDAASQSLQVGAISIDADKLTLYYQNNQYELEAEAIGRLVRVLMADAPTEIETFDLVAVDNGIPLQAILVSRAALEHVYATNGVAGDFRDAIKLQDPPLNGSILDIYQPDDFPRFSWSASPSIRLGLFDPKQPARVQFLAMLGGGVEILPGLSLNTELEANIYNTFTTSRPSDSVLPHVRSDIAKYLTKGENGIGALDANYMGRIAPDIFVEAKVGYLEDMFAGAGGQILWRPEGDRWAVGADIYEVWQRNFDRLFGLQHYHVLTGHISLYYHSPWHGIDVALHAGRYLAGDHGVTMEISREFSTGIEIGAFVTLTNVPFTKFGEGSFDKGIMIHIPLEWALPFSTQSSYDLTLRPLTRDGGQRLDGDDSLYEETRRTSFGEISEHADDIIYP